MPVRLQLATIFTSVRDNTPRGRSGATKLLAHTIRDAWHCPTSRSFSPRAALCRISLAIRTRIAQRGSGGGTTIYDAVYLCSNLIAKKQTGRKALILLTDGEAEFSPCSRLQTRLELRLTMIQASRLRSSPQPLSSPE
jgi:hypothetical protein